MNLAGGATRQLTGDALSDYWPSLSANGSRVAFQRARPTPTEGFQFIDARVLVADTTRPGALEPQVVADGFSPRVSPDGNWVAYYQRLPDPTRLRLLVKNITTGEVRTISDDCALPSFSFNPPVDWAGQNLTWGSASELYFLAAAPERYELRRADLNAPAGPTVMATAPTGGIRDIHVSVDGTMVAYLMSVKKTDAAADAERLTEVRVRHVREDRDAVVVREAAPAGGLFLPGWTSRNSLILQRTKAVVAGVHDLQLTEVAADGTRREVATLPTSFASTVRLDQARGRLYLTRAVGGIHNIHLLTLADGKMRQLTSNETPGVSFSGIQPLGDDAIVFARDERRRDIWLVKRK